MLLKVVPMSNILKHAIFAFSFCLFVGGGVFVCLLVLVLSFNLLVIHFIFHIWEKVPLAALYPLSLHVLIPLVLP